MTKKQIIFAVSSELVPYELLRYLEYFHVKVWPIKINWHEDRSRTCYIKVNEKQFLWAARLIKGYSDQVKVIEPKHIKGTRPKSKWQDNQIKTSGIKNFILRTVGDILLPVSSKIPGTKKK